MVLFTDDSGTIIEKEDNFDPKTGENLSINDFVNKVRQKGGNVTPINIFQDSKGQRVAVPYGREKEFSALGLKPINQIDAENSAQAAKNKLESGDIGYSPDKLTSFISGLGRGLSANLEPQIEGAIEGGLNVLKGNKFKPAYEQAKLREEAINTAAQKTNPNSYLGGDILGGVTQMASGNEASPIEALQGLGSLGRNVLGGAVAGGASEGIGAANKNQDIENSALKGAAIGGVGAGIGTEASKFVGSTVNPILKNAANKLITPEAKQAFVSSLKGKDFSDPVVQEQALNIASDYTGDLKNTIDQVRQLIGKQKGEHLDNIGSVDHTPLFDSLERTYNNLDQMANKTGDTETIHAINQAKDKILGAYSTLEKNPNSAKAIDTIKRDLGGSIYNTQGFKSDFFDVSQALEGARSDAQKYLENLLPNKLKGTNQAYKDVLEAQNPQEAYDKVIPDLSQIDSLTKGNKSLVTRKRLNNLQAFNEDIQNNEQIPSNIKQILNNRVNGLSKIIDDASLATKANSSPNLNPLNSNNQVYLGSKLGTYYSPENNRVISFLNTTKENLEPGLQKVFDSLPKNIQNLILNSPEFSSKLASSLPQSSGVIYNKVKDSF